MSKREKTFFKYHPRIFRKAAQKRQETFLSIYEVEAESVDVDEKFSQIYNFSRNAVQYSSYEKKMLQNLLLKCNSFSIKSNN